MSSTPEFTLCDHNRDWVFRHTFHAPDGQALSGRIVCHECGRRLLFDLVFSNCDTGYWTHQSLSNGTWPIPPEISAELDRKNFCLGGLYVFHVRSASFDFQVWQLPLPSSAQLPVAPVQEA
jgi:hypothetical protein